MRSVVSDHVESLTIVDLHSRDSVNDNDNDEPDQAARMVADATEPIEPRLKSVLASAELVICALPEDALVAALPQLIAVVETGALVVDTASVKSPLPAVWSPTGPSILSINPMFAPSLSPVDRPVLSITGGRRGRQDDFLDLLRHIGMVVVQLADAGEHDRLAAVIQVGVHAAALAYGLTLAGAGFSGQRVVEVAPPPCRQQLMLLARMVTQPPEVYEDIQRSNPYAEQVRADLIEHIAEIGRLAATGNLSSAISSIANWLGDGQVPLAELCQGVFDKLAAQSGSTGSGP